MRKFLDKVGSSDEGEGEMEMEGERGKEEPDDMAGIDARIEKLKTLEAAEAKRCVCVCVCVCVRRNEKNLLKLILEA